MQLPLRLLERPKLKERRQPQQRLKEMRAVIAERASWALQSVIAQQFAQVLAFCAAVTRQLTGS
jgi:hypothetical protein